MLRLIHDHLIFIMKEMLSKKKHVMEHGPGVEQLRCAGVVAAITISQSTSFPNRLPNISVLTRYNSTTIVIPVDYTAPQCLSYFKQPM